MVKEGVIVESLPDRPLTARERDVLEQHDRIQSVMAQKMHFDSEHGEIMYGAMFIGEDWVVAVNYEEGQGWEVIYRSEMEDNIIEDGFLRSEDLYDDHPIRQGMDAMADARESADEE